MEKRNDVPLEVIDAFVDGERVDVDALKTALSDAAGRDYLVDVWLMREAVQSEPSKEAIVVAPPVTAQPRRMSPLWMAAAVATALIGGYAAGQTIGRNTVREVASPATSPVAVSPAPRANEGAFPMPMPTRVIQLEFHSTSAANGGD